MKTMFIQTSDASVYIDMLLVTSKTTRRFCQRAGCDFESFIGIKKGLFAWHATFNRAYMLEDLVRRGHKSWVCYLDADAWIHDLAFPIESYLEEKAEFGGIFVQSGATNNWYDVNAGVMFLNLGNDVGREIVAKWIQAIEAVWHLVENLTTWPENGPEDQSLLQIVLKENNLQDSVFFEKRNLINSNYAAFIRQLLRSEVKEGFIARARRIEQAVNEVLRDKSDIRPQFSDAEKAVARGITDGLYKGLLGRRADGGPENQYYNVILERGIERGVETSVEYIIGSKEFRSRHG